MLLEYVKARTKANHKATQSDTKRTRSNGTSQDQLYPRPHQVYRL